MVNKRILRTYVDAPGMMRQLMISDAQLRMVKLVRDFDQPTMTAFEVCTMESISIQSAATRLKRLCDIGYLKRKAVRIDGRMIYHYSYAL